MIYQNDYSQRPESDYKTKARICFVLRLVISVLFLFALNLYMDKTLFPSFVLEMGAFTISYVLLNGMQKVSWRLRFYILLYSTFYAAALVIGKQIYLDHSIANIIWPLRNLVQTFILIVPFSAVLCGAISYCINSLSKACENTIDQKIFSKGSLLLLFKHRYVGLIITIINILICIPVMLAYYPGVLSYDTDKQTLEALGGLKCYTSYHPPFHTAIWSACLHIAPYIHLEAVTIYAVIQILFISCVTSKMLCYMARNTENEILLLGCVIMATLNPILAVFSIEITKDVVFGGILLLAAIRIRDALTSIDEPFRVIDCSCTVICILLACCFRNNAVYSLICLFPIALVLYSRNWRKITIMFGLPIILYFFITGLCFPLVGIESGPSREKWSIPIQQIARSASNHYDELTEEERNEVEHYFPNKAVMDYNPRFADPVKSQFNEQYYRDHKGGFFRLWVNLLKKYPVEYSDAFLTLHIPYWYPDADPIDPYANRLYIETYIYDLDQYVVERKSLLPGALTFYESIADYSLLRKIPILNRWDALSMPMWLLAACFLATIYQRKKAEFLVISMYGLLFITFLLGPVSNLRYMYPVIIASPLLIAYSLKSSNDNSKSCI